MEKRIARYFGHSMFIVYFSLLVLIPITHSHDAVELLPESSTIETGHGLSLFSVVQCCEFHEGSSEADHIHFLTDDQDIIATRHNRPDSTPVPQVLAAVDKVFLLKPSHQWIGIIAPMADFYQEAVLSYSSGLSPPLS